MMEKCQTGKVYERRWQRRRADQARARVLSVTVTKAAVVQRCDDAQEEIIEIALGRFTDDEG